MPMTEAEWLACTDPQPMLEFLRGKASDRKLRLFACACCRALDPDLGTSEPARAAIEAAERYVDGAECREELETASRAAAAASYAPWIKSLEEGRFTVTDSEKRQGWLARMARWASDAKKPEAAQRAAEAANSEWMISRLRPPGWEGRLAFLLHDIFGNPFRPLTADPALLTPPVITLAQAMYDGRAFHRLPVLADALEDAGCTNADILSHLRGPGPHVRGCWAVDLILGKE
jgi:hypothetical protein